MHSHKAQRCRSSQSKTSSKTAKPLSTRALAAQVIVQVLDQGKSLSTLLPTLQGKVQAQDAALLQEICFGVCRVLPRLEKILALLLDKPLKGKTRIVHCLLLVGLYQLLYTRIPAHAAVDEVVNAAKGLKVDNFRALLNGVLRRFLRQQEEILPKVDQHWQTLHPDWLINLLKPYYPNWREIISANNQKPPMWLRVNQQHTSARDYQALLAQQNIKAIQVPQSPDCALLLEKAVGVTQLPAFQEGQVSVQDCNAQWAAMLLEPQANELILDACAAPGGKTSHLLELAPTAKVIALDIDQQRLKRVQENLHRMQLSATVVCGDATQPEQWLNPLVQQGLIAEKRGFDKILLDAPCSATGVIRRHPDIKWLRQAEDISQLVNLQAQILDALWEKLKPNGTLLYATCSVLPQENCEQIKAFLQRQPNAELIPLTAKLPANTLANSEYGCQFLPTELGGDGFFYAKLRKLPMAAT